MPTLCRTEMGVRLALSSKSEFELFPICLQNRLFFVFNIGEPFKCKSFFLDLRDLNHLLCFNALQMFQFQIVDRFLS